MQKIQQEVGLHESLTALHQCRSEVVVVAFVVDPGGRCLMIDGNLPQKPHVCLGTQKCALPFAEQVVQSIPGLVKARTYGLARTYDDVQVDGVSVRAYVIVRVDVRESKPVPGGEWVNSAERAIALSQGDPVPLRCIQKYFGDKLSWQLPAERLS